MFTKRHQGVICKIAAGRYYILTPRGDFESFQGRPPHSLTVGDNISVAKVSQAAKMLAVAVAFLFFIGAGALLLPGTSAPIYVLSVDFNPSLVFCYDDSFALAEARAFNEAGLALLAELELELGENLYAVLNRLATISLAQGLLAPDGEIYFTSSAGSPLDQDLLLGAFEGRGVNLKLVQVALEGKTDIKASSPLRDWLEKLAVEAGSDPKGEAIQVLADKYLPPSIATRTVVTGWFEAPLVQYLVGEYRVSGGFVNSLLTRGFSGEDIALILALANEEKVSPGQLVQNVSQPEKVREQLVHKEGYQQAQVKALKARELDDERQSLEFLAAEFGYPVGRLTALLKQAGDIDTLTALLVIERQGVSNLNRLLQGLKEAGGNLDKLVETEKDPAVDRDIKPELDKVKETTNRARGQESAEVDEIVVETGSSRSNIVWLLSRGYSRPQCQDIQRAAQLSGKSVPDVTRILESSRDMEDFLNRLGISELQLPQLKKYFQKQEDKDKPGPRTPGISKPRIP